jgi:hypothetical protein
MFLRNRRIFIYHAVDKILFPAHKFWQKSSSRNFMTFNPYVLVPRCKNASTLPFGWLQIKITTIKNKNTGEM